MLMLKYKFLAYIFIAVGLTLYGAWLKKVKPEGGATSFLHKDITGILIVLGVIAFLTLYLIGKYNPHQ